MARRAAELRRFHMFNSPVRQLSSDQDIKQGGYGQKPRKAPERGPAIEGRPGEAPADPALDQVHADSNHGQASEESDRKDQEDDDPDVRIADVAPNLLWEHEQERKPGGRDQRHTGET